MIAYQEISEIWTSSIKRAILYPMLAIALIINVGGLFMLTFKPASNGDIAMVEYIHKHYNQVTLYTAAGSNPYIYFENVKGLTPRFYTNNKVKVKSLAEVLNLQSQEKLHDNDLVMLRASYSEQRYLKQLGFKEKHRSIPRWIEKMDQFYKVLPNYETVFVLYSKK
jgi:hypothetical protein